MKLKDIFKKAESEFSLEKVIEIINHTRERCPNGDTIILPLAWALMAEQHCDDAGIPIHHSGDGCCETAATYMQLANYVQNLEID